MDIVYAYKFESSKYLGSAKSSLYSVSKTWNSLPVADFLEYKILDNKKTWRSAVLEMAR